MKHLHEINGHYAVRIVVPPELRGYVGRSELREWLGRDKRIAERNAHEVIGRFHTQIDEARTALVAAQPTIRRAAKGHYASELTLDDRERATGSTVELRKLTTPLRASMLRLLAAGEMDDGQAEALMGDAADMIQQGGKAPAGVDRRTLLRALAEVQLEALERFEERDGGKVALGAPKSRLLTEDDEPADEPSTGKRKGGSGPTLSALLADFHKERTRPGARTLSDKTMDEHKVAVRMLEEFLGASPPAASITKADMIAYKGALLDTPVNYRLRFPKLALPDAIKANAKRSMPYPTLNPQTANVKWLGHIRTIMGWCENNGLLTSNPARGVKVDMGKGFKEPARAAFSQDDLKRIFGHAMFADPADYSTRHWALLIALYTGARSSSEVARIKLNDVMQEQGVWVFSLEEATKNLRSRRLVPVHKKLVELGLLDYIDRLRAAGKVKLFADWDPEDKINRWFLRTYKAEVGIDDPRKVFHSFRRTLKTALGRYGVNRDVSDLITGHKDQSVAGSYIDDASLTLIEAMNEALNRVDFGLGI